MAYIRQRDLSNLRNYRYSGIDRSLISYYILKPFYTNFVIKCFPLSIAPNLITLSGFGFIIINVLTLLYYNPTLDQDCPPWVYLSWAVGLFLYQTFDAVDGLQARRTHQSGPLGELFDHGVDALNTSLGVLIFAGCLNLGMGWKTITSLFGAQLTFYVQTWEEYHTKTLTLGIFNGPVEGVLILVFIYVFTAFTGKASFWQQPILETFGIQTPSYGFQHVYNLSFSDLFIFQGTILFVLNVLQSSLNVVHARQSHGKKSRLALLGLVPFIVTWMLIILYLNFNREILDKHLVSFTMFAGLVNSYSVGQIIIAHIAQLSFPYYNVLVLPIACGILISLPPLTQRFLWSGLPGIMSSREYQVAYCFCMLGCAIGVYGSFVVDVIVTICDYLDIWCLTIKHPWNEKENNDKIKKST